MYLTDVSMQLVSMLYVGESLITRIDVTTKGKSASVNSDFDDLF